MSSTAERFALLKEKLEKAREENLKAVEDETRKAAQLTTQTDHKHTNNDSEHRGPLNGRSNTPKRTRSQEAYVDVGSADEAEGEDEDGGIRSMKRRARKVHREQTGEESRKDGVLLYGGAGDTVSPENAERMVQELKDVERRRANFRRRRTFNEDRSDINFINEGNRLFNRTLDRHFDKYESVRKIKDSLERGTA